MAADLSDIDRHLADRLAGVEQIEDTVARRDPANLGRGVDKPALRRHVRDRNEFGGGTDRLLKRAEVELPGGGVVDHVDSDAGPRFHLQKREIVRQVFGALDGDKTYVLWFMWCRLDAE
jgi:hypothetical protein